MTAQPRLRFSPELAGTLAVAVLAIGGLFVAWCLDWARGSHLIGDIFGWGGPAVVIAIVLSVVALSMPHRLLPWRIGVPWAVAGTIVLLTATWAALVPAPLVRLFVALTLTALVHLGREEAARLERRRVSLREHYSLVLLGIWLAVAALTFAPYGVFPALVAGILLIQAYYLALLANRLPDTIEERWHALFDRRSSPAASSAPEVPAALPSDPGVKDPFATSIIEFIREREPARWPNPEIIDHRDAPICDIYILKPSSLVSVREVEKWRDDMSMRVGNEVIITPKPGRGIMIQINKPENLRRMVYLRDIEARANELHLLDKHPYAFVSGMDMFDNPVVIDMEAELHSLFGGVSGSGKTFFLHTMLIGLLRRTTPAQLKLAIVDPKLVEGMLYEKVPHLGWPIPQSVAEVPALFQAILTEMERRKKILGEVKLQKVEDFNKEYPERALPLVLLVIDEAAMLANGEKTVKESYLSDVGRIAQEARAFYIRLVVGTQRCAVDNVGKNIRPQLARSIALRVTRESESFMVTGEDNAGAQYLTGKGDTLLFDESQSGESVVRYRGCFFSTADLKGYIQEVIERYGENTFDATTAQPAKLPHTSEVNDVQWLTLMAVQELIKDLVGDLSTRTVSVEEILDTMVTVTPPNLLMKEQPNTNDMRGYMLGFGFIHKKNSSGRYIVQPRLVHELIAKYHAPMEPLDAGNVVSKDALDKLRAGTRG